MAKIINFVGPGTILIHKNDLKYIEMIINNLKYIVVDNDIESYIVKKVPSEYDDYVFDTFEQAKQQLIEYASSRKKEYHKMIEFLMSINETEYNP